MLDALGRWTARHASAVCAVWVLLVAAGFATALLGVTGQGLFDRLTTGEPRLDSESQTGRELLEAAADSGPRLTLMVDGVDPADPRLAASLAEGRQALAAVPGVQAVIDPPALPPTNPAAAALVSQDGRAVLVDVALERDLDTEAEDRAVAQVSAELDQLGERVEQQLPDASAEVGGIPLLVDAITEQVEVDLRTGEMVALPVSLVLMVGIFGGFLAAGMPIVGAVAAISGALATLLGFSYLIDLDASVVNVVTVLGLGLSIDYGLLMVSRFREELRRAPVHGPPPEDALLTRRQLKLARRNAQDPVGAALGRTLASAGRTVVFSAVTVAISISGLLLFEADILRAIGAAGVSVVAVALLVSLTLVPATIALAGQRLVRPGFTRHVPVLRGVLARFGDVAPPEGGFSRLGRRVQRHPLLVLVSVTAVLLLLAAPALRIELRNSGAELLPTSFQQRQFFDTLAERFPATQRPAVQVVADTTAEQAAAYADGLTDVPGVTSVDPPVPRGDYQLIGVRTETDPSGPLARDVVRAVRGDRPAFDTWVAGRAATQLDFTSSLADGAPLATAVVVLATFVLLFLMTGSILVPLKALAMNVVSLGASVGVLVWVFQDGHLSDLLDFTPAGGIESFIPPLVLAFGFGLSMDYEVFLLARIQEARAAGLGNDAAVVQGLQRSGRIITSAALIIVIVFAGFVAGELLVIKQTGVALAVAVAIDATLVRCLLVPATMTLLGEWNWWAPGPLRRVHARIGLREGPA